VRPRLSSAAERLLRIVGSPGTSASALLYAATAPLKSCAPKHWFPSALMSSIVSPPPPPPPPPLSCSCAVASSLASSAFVAPRESGPPRESVVPDSSLIAP
jgi:hypothetical protein